METVLSCMQSLDAGGFDAALIAIYGVQNLSKQRQRYATLLQRMETWGEKGRAVFVSTPGRTELGGNHTDHNNGIVLAASISLDCLALASVSRTNVVRVRSEGFPGIVEVALDDLSPREAEQGTTVALVRGVLSGITQAGYTVGGADICVSGEVPVGVGLSSSAAFEVCIGQVFNHLFNGGMMTSLDLARVARRAENLHFNKPCGFMDQIACAEHGVISIDFEDKVSPKVTSLDIDFSDMGHQLCVVDTGGDHVDLTPEYAAIPDEMQQAAQVLGHDVARGVALEEVLGAAPAIRKQAGGRALLRLIHFVEENERVVSQMDALGKKDYGRYLELVKESGDASWRLLQNCVSIRHVTEQPLTVALTLTERFLQGKGAWRVQGGGFAGTIQAYVPHDLLGGYVTAMEAVFGVGAVVPLSLRSFEAQRVLPS